MPGGINHVKTDTAGQPSILRALLEQTSRDDVHSKMKNKEALDLKNKKKSKEIKVHKTREDLIHNTLKEPVKENNNTQQDTKVNKINSNQIKQTKIINKNNQIKETEINDKTNQIKWKNIMTIIHNSAIRNINLTCGENCILKKEASESEISSGETMSMHSGTDSQYERISPDMLSEKQRRNVSINEDVIIEISNDSFNNERIPEKPVKVHRIFQPEEIYTYPDINPDGSEEDNLNILPKQPDEIKKTSTEKRNPHRENSPVEEAEKTCKKEKINIGDKKGKIKVKNKLIPYYKKIRSKLQAYQIYFLKRHLKLLKAITKVKNNELKYQEVENNLKDKMNIPTTRSDIETNQIDCVETKDQSESTAIGGETTRDLHQRTIRDQTKSVTHNLDTHNACQKLTDYQGNNVKIDMEREETRLLRLFKEKCRRRENEIVRRRARIEHLRQLIEELPDSDEIPSEEDRRIEQEIDEAEKIYNSRNENRTIFRVMEDVCDLNGTEVATFDATINFKTDPTRMRADKQAILIALLIKNRELKLETKLLGDVDMDTVKGIQFKIPVGTPTEGSGRLQPEKSTEENVPKTTSEVSTKNVSMGKGESPVSICPEETHCLDSETTSRDTSLHGEEERSHEPDTPTPESREQRKRKRNSSRCTQQKKQQIYSSDSDSEENSEEEPKPKKKKTKKTTRRKKSEENKTPKTRAKDGRKLADVTNRIRDSKGRLLGYKPGMEPEKIQSKKKSSSLEPERASKPTPERRAKIKMPSVTPAPATQELQIAVKKLLTKQTLSIVPQPTLPLDILQDADIERARSMRPTSSVRIDTASQRGAEPLPDYVDQPEGESKGSATRAPIEEEVELPATQPYVEEDDERRPSSPGGSQPAEQLGGQVRQVE